MRTYRTLALVALAAAVPLSVACGDEGDDSPPGSTGGNAGDAGDAGDSGRGGNSGQGGNNGGTTNGGTTNGGTDMGGQAGEETGGTGGSTGGTGTGGSSGGGCDLTEDGQSGEETLPADIMDDMTLTSGTTWRVDGFVKVHSGATLTIDPCTRIVGSPSPSPGVLAVLQGGQIDAAGTADEPILFTSESPPGARSAGQWGGVVLLGRAPITAATDSKVFEGLTDADFTYGGDDPEDSSGTMQYVRIEYAGWNLTPDKEINGLSMAGVGSGTTLDHIMVSNIRDDCYEWWGGTVDADYLICNNPGDDMFDTDEGYIATGNYWFGRRTAVGAISSTDPTGFEWDGTESGQPTLTPRTHVTATYVTLCGTGANVSGGGGTPEYGMVFRDAATGAIDSLALLGFEYGFDTRAVSGNMFGADDMTIDNSVFWSLMFTPTAADSSDNDGGFDEESILTAGTGNDTEPNPLPFELEDCQDEGGPTDAVKDSDIGAFTGDATWMNGLWVDFSPN